MDCVYFNRRICNQTFLFNALHILSVHEYIRTCMSCCAGFKNMIHSACRLHIPLSDYISRKRDTSSSTIKVSLQSDSLVHCSKATSNTFHPPNSNSSDKYISPYDFLFAIVFASECPNVHRIVAPTRDYE